MTKKDPLKAILALHENAQKAREKLAESEFSIATTVGRAVLALSADASWPTRQEVIALLAEIAAGSQSLPNVLPEAAEAAHKFISASSR